MLIGIDASRAVRPQRTGTENYARGLIAALVAHAPHETFRLYIDRRPDWCWLAEAPQVAWVPIPRPRLWTHVGLGPELARRPPDVFFEPAHVLPVQHPPASLVTVHDLGYEYFPEAHPLLQRLYLRLTTRWHVWVARALLADSEATRQDLIRLYGADPEKIQVVYPGVDLERFHPVADGAVAAARAQHGLPEDYLFYVGTLQPRKNLARLIEAFGLIASAFPQTVLALAGRRGWLYDDLKALVQRLGLAARVRFLGYVGDETVPALLSGARAFVFPSLFEGFGLPILEAQACGTAVLTSTTSSCAEVAGDGALLVVPTDTAAIAGALRQLLAEPALRATLIDRGAANVRRFTWAAAAATTYTILQDIAAQ